MAAYGEALKRLGSSTRRALRLRFDLWSWSNAAGTVLPPQAFLAARRSMVGQVVAAAAAAAAAAPAVEGEAPGPAAASATAAEVLSSVAQAVQLTVAQVGLGLHTFSLAGSDLRWYGGGLRTGEHRLAANTARPAAASMPKP